MKVALTGLSDSISSQDISRWNEEIMFAKNEWHHNAAAMDIMASHWSNLEANELQANVSTSDSPGITWITMALSIEERQ